MTPYAVSVAVSCFELEILILNSIEKKDKANPRGQGLVRQLKRIAKLIRWNIQSLTADMRKGRRSSKRLLVVYDFASQPFSIGDILMCQEASLVLRQQFALGQVDLALVYDPANPVVPDPAFSTIRSDNFLWHLTTVLQAAAVNAHLGSVFLFDSHANLERFISRHLDMYEIWPSLKQYANREYLYYHIFNEVLYDHFQQFGSLPSLSSRSPARAWADKFIDEHVSPHVAVTVQLRRSQTNPARNSDYETWRSFLRTCRDRYPVRFVIIGAHHEMDTSFREFPNVLFAKDYCTTVEQDLAIIEVASMHLGASSGPGVMAIFSKKPYCFFNTGMHLDRYKGLIQDGKASRMFFATTQQRFIHEREDNKTLLTEFERMWEAFQNRKGMEASAAGEA